MNTKAQATCPDVLLQPDSRLFFFFLSESWPINSLKNYFD